MKKMPSRLVVNVAAVANFQSCRADFLANPRGTGRTQQLRMTIKTYRDLETWQACISVVEQTYRLTRSFPGFERFGLCGQMQRASVSMPSNVAEGWARTSAKVYFNHVDIAIGSHAELETCVEVARRLKYVDQQTFDAFMQPLDRSGQLLNGLLRSLR